MYFNIFWSFKHALDKYRLQELTSFHPSTQGIYSKGTWCHTPDKCWTELESLTSFNKNILKKSCFGGSPAAKSLSSKFITKTASVPVPSHNANANAVYPLANAAPAAPVLPLAPAAVAASVPP